MTERIKLTEDDIAMSPDTHAECCFSEGTYVLVINSKIPRKGLFDYPEELKQLKQQILADELKLEKLKQKFEDYKENNKAVLVCLHDYHYKLMDQL